MVSSLEELVDETSFLKIVSKLLVWTAHWSHRMVKHTKIDERDEIYMSSLLL